MKYLRLLLILLILGFIVSCNTTPPPAEILETPLTNEQKYDALTIVELDPQGVSVKPSTQIRANVIPFGKNKLDAIISVDRATGTVVFDKSLLSAADLAKMIPDSIIVGYHPQRAKRGLIRKIVSVTDLGSSLRVVTTQGKLKEVFADGGFRVQKRNTVTAASKFILPDGQVLPMKVAPANAQTRGLVEVNIEKTFCPVNTDGNKNTKNDQICITGKFGLDLGFDFSFDCEGFLCTNPYLDTHVTLTQTSNIKVEGKLTRTLDKDYLLGTLSIGSLTVPVLSVPLVFVAQVEVRLQLNGKVSAEINWVADQSLEFTAGVELKDGNFKPYTKFDSDVKTSDIDVSIDASAKATLRGELSVLLYGITGPYLSAEAWVNLEAGFPRNPTWEITAGLDWFLGVKLDLFGLVNASWEEKLTGTKWDIAEAKNTKPIITVQEPVDEEEMTLPNELEGSILEAYYVDFRVKADDAQDGVNCCTLLWFVDDFFKLQTNPGSGHDATLLVSGTGPNNDGRHKIRIESIDSDGAKTIKRFNIKINKCENTNALLLTGKKFCILQAPFNPMPYPYPLPTTW